MAKLFFIIIHLSQMSASKYVGVLLCIVIRHFLLLFVKKNVKIKIKKKKI